jgi:hypothetical protein
MDFRSLNTSADPSTFPNWILHSRHVLEKVRAAAGHTSEAIPATCTTTFDFATALNVERIETGRSNTNAALEFTQAVIALKSPLELPDLMAAYARKQLELWAKQMRESSNLAQKVTRQAEAA